MNRITEADVEKETVVQSPPKRARLVKSKEQRAGADEISPGLRLMLIGIRSGLLQAADSIADYLGLEKRRRDFD